MDDAKESLHASEPAPYDIRYFLENRKRLPIATQEEVRPKKRRKADPGSRIYTESADPTDYLTLAKVDLKIIFPSDSSSTICPLSQALPQAQSEALPVLLTKFTQDDQDDAQSQTYQISLTTVDGLSLCQTTLSGSLTRGNCENVKDAVALTHPSRVLRAKSSFSISKILSPSENHNIHDVPGRPWAFLLTIRILVPDAKSLADRPGLPRSPDLLHLFGPSAVSRSDLWSPKDFYDHVHVPDPESASDLLPVPQLHCNLYPFQRRAIRWLLEREGALRSGSKPDQDELAHGFLRSIDGDGRECFRSRLLGLATSEESLVRPSTEGLLGGILSEEMGLGKTVEVIALICLHRRGNFANQEHTPTNTIKSAGTLIITPPSILQQWKDELQALAPSLKVATYDGMRIEGQRNDDAELRQKCVSNDVILTTYPILARDIHHAEAPAKSLRHEKRYEKRLSPLTQIHWWRIVLDEAQMVESGVSNAARVASLIPRQMAWCVSGTPARNAKDLLGLLIFLRFQPYCSLPLIWDRLVNQHRDILWSIFSTIALRHTKTQVRNEIRLPNQKRVVLNVPFTQIEEQHYSSLFQQMAGECGLDVEGAPLREDWDPEDPQTIDKMRTWLVRLRQTCLHPEVGNRNRKALGSGKGPLRTVAEVLEVMIDQNDHATRTEERNVLMSQIRRGQILEHAEKTQEALAIWLSTLEEARSVVHECRRQLRLELDKLAAEGMRVGYDGDAEVLDVSRTGPHRQRLRAALEVEHMCTFFVANAYFQLKTKEIALTRGLKPILSNSGGADEASSIHQTSAQSSVDDAAENVEKPLSEHGKELERQEEIFYDVAKSLRRELLTEAREKVHKLISKVKDKQSHLIFIPDVKPLNDPGGIQSRHLCEKAERLIRTMRAQTSQVMEWRSKSLKLLTLPLVDQEETELQGDEYETSTKQQEEVYVYVDALRALVSDRRVSVNGQENQLIEHEMKFILKEAEQGRGHSPQLLIQLLKKRQELKPKEALTSAGPKNRQEPKPKETLVSVRGLMTELRELKSNLRPHVEKSNAAAAETLLINNMMQHLHQISVEVTKPLDALDKEVELFKDTMNLRLEYYRQLQAISDTVAPFEEEMSDEQRTNVLVAKAQDEQRLKYRITTLKSNGRYLLYLRGEAADTKQRTCIICTSPFEMGVLTSCGHTYCGECLRLWWARNRSCPTCKKHLSRNDFHQITFKPKELTMEEEDIPTTEQLTSKSGDATTAIYAGVRESTLNQIKDIDLDGSFGTKIDTLARHLLWIREHDAGAKSIVFSQYKDFLDVLSRAFSHFKISFTGIDRKDGIRRFKNDPNIECFFLHAKAHSSGLNLVNATHVFLCEPLINTAIELQAIARVHRIGQHNETTVWMYLVEGTVEKSIYDISVQRRLAHMGQLEDERQERDEPNRFQVQEPDESQLEQANTAELEQNPLSHLLTKGASGGELVRKGDLWNCLFSSKPAQARPSQEAQVAIAHHLGANAAEERMRGNEETTI